MTGWYLNETGKTHSDKVNCSTMKKLICLLNTAAVSLDSSYSIMKLHHESVTKQQCKLFRAIFTNKKLHPFEYLLIMNQGY